MIKNPVEFTAHTDIVVIGNNPENADFDNPRGDIYGERAYVRARNEYGDTCMFFLKTTYSRRECLPEAEAMAEALNVRLANGKLPVAFDRWISGRAVYGSPAYEDYGAAEDIAWERENQF